jgi:uncharacterized membrane protein YqjE
VLVEMVEVVVDQITTAHQRGTEQKAQKTEQQIVAAVVAQVEMLVQLATVELE